MSSTFFGLSIASTGLNAFQASINTTANNVSNAKTNGYSKQTVNLSASSALRTFEKYGSVGTGVTAASVTQMRDIYYDQKYWTNQSNYGYYDKKNYYMQQIEGYYTDSAANPGFSTIFGSMFDSMDQLQENAGDTSVRNEVISNAQKLTTYFNSTSERLSELQGSVNDEIKTTVDTINSSAQKIGLLNKQINVIEMQGGEANELRDQRALIIDDLSKIVSVEVNEDKVVNSNYPDMNTGATKFSLKVNGQTLVDNFNYRTMTTTARTEKYNQSDIDGLYDVAWADSGASIDFKSDALTGSLKALFELRDGNDNGNVTGKAAATTSTSITITSPSVTNISDMNLPSSGMLTVNNTQYAYNSFTAVTDANEKIVSYTFQLDSAITNETQDRMNGMTVTVGDSVNYKGIPYYQNQMNSFLRNFSRAFNDIQKSGEDLNGKQGTSFFVAKDNSLNQEDTFTDSQTSTTLNGLSNCYYRMTANNVAINSNTVASPSLMATTNDIDKGVDSADLVDNLLDLESKTKIFRNGGADDFLQCIYADITVDTQECSTFQTNYQSIQKTIQQQRQSISGVDEDEEALDLVKYQNAYNLASKVISTMAEMYDQLILSTGV